MADPSPVNPEKIFAEKFAEIGRQLRDLQSLTGTQKYQAVERLQDGLADLQANLPTLVAGLTYTKAQIDDQMAGKAATAHTHTQADVTGTWTKDVNGTNVTGTNVYATSAPGYNITGTRVAAWWESATGRAGTASSSERYKTSIRDLDITPEVILDVVPVYYQYIEALQHAEWRRTCGPPFKEWDPTARAPLEVGMIAERLHEAGLWQFVVYKRDDWGKPLRNEAGEVIPDGIHYPNWGIALQLVARWERDRRVVLERRVDALAHHLNLDI